MSRKIIVFLVVLSLLSVFGVAYAHPEDGCYATASAATIKEDEPVIITVRCDNIPTANNVFGFQIGTTRAGDFDATVAPTTYTPGTFSDGSTGVTSSVITGANSMSSLYAVSRQGSETVSTTAFTLGSYVLTAEDDLTTDGSIVITMTDADFILSDNLGESLLGWLRDVNDFTVTVTNIDLAWLTGDLVVRSDVENISNALSINLALGDQTFNVTNVASYTNTFNMDAEHQYSEDGTPAGDGVLSINVSADMTGHLVCSNTVDLGDAGTSIDVDTKAGTGGVITLKAGDADNDGDIDNTDATAIGANLGTNPADDRDINGDATLNILDLVHVGRNYNATSETCGTGS